MMITSPDLALKNVFINRDLSFLLRCTINVISLKVNKLKEHFNVNTLVQKYLFTFSGDKSEYRARKIRKYINLVQCYFFSSANNLLGEFLSRCSGIERAVKNVIFKRYNPSLYATSVVFRRLCRREVFDLNVDGQYNDRHIIYQYYSHSRAIEYCSANSKQDPIGHFYTYHGFSEVLKYRFFCIFGGKNTVSKIVENTKKKVSNNQCITKLFKNYQQYFCYINHGVIGNHATFVLFRYLESYFINGKGFYVTNRPYIPRSYLNEISRSLCHLRYVSDNINSISYTYNGHILYTTIGRVIEFNDCSVIPIFYKNILCYNCLACWIYWHVIFNIRPASTFSFKPIIGITGLFVYNPLFYLNSKCQPVTIFIGSKIYRRAFTLLYKLKINFINSINYILEFINLSNLIFTRSFYV